VSCGLSAGQATRTTRVGTAPTAMPLQAGIGTRAAARLLAGSIGGRVVAHPYRALVLLVVDCVPE
jgi:hypothetical protein